MMTGLLVSEMEETAQSVWVSEYPWVSGDSPMMLKEPLHRPMSLSGQDMALVQKKMGKEEGGGWEYMQKYHNFID